MEVYTLRLFKTDNPCRSKVCVTDGVIRSTLTIDNELMQSCEGQDSFLKYEVKIIIKSIEIFKEGNK